MESHNHPSLHRAVPGRGDRRRRHPARRLHDGRAAHREPRLAALRPPRSPAHAGAAPRRRRRHRRLRQLHRRAHRRRRAAFRRAPTTATSSSTPSPAASRAPTASSTGARAASATRSSTSAPRPGATASTARRWRATSSPRGGPSQRPTVQVGDPFMEKLLLEACLEIFAEDLLVGIQDMGAAGLTSSSVEMAGRSGSGLDLDLDAVPAPREGADALRDAPQRVAGAHAPRRAAGQGGARPRDLREVGARRRGHRPGHRHAAAGSSARRPATTRSPTRPSPRAPVVVCDLPVDFLTDAAPKYDRPQRDDADAAPRGSRFDPATHPDARPTSGEALLDARRLAERRLAALGLAAVRPHRPRRHRRAARAATPPSCACRARRTARSSRSSSPSPATATARHRASSTRSRAARWPWPRCAATSSAAARSRSASPTASTSATPSGPRSCASSRARSTASPRPATRSACPIVSGNVSLYNETDGARSILPTPTIGAVGLVRDASDVVHGAVQARRATSSCCSGSASSGGARSAAASGSCARRASCRARRRALDLAPRRGSRRCVLVARRAPTCSRARTTSPTAASRSRSPSAAPTGPEDIGARVELRRQRARRRHAREASSARRRHASS